MKPISNHFMACSAEPKDAETILFGVPYDGTSSFRPGSRFAPDAIRTASYGVETYSPAQDKDMEDRSFADVGDVELCFGNKDVILASIKDFARDVLKDGRFLAIGGEHLVTLPLVEAVLEQGHEELYILHFDAHADLRQDYMGEEQSHATVMRRLAEQIGFDHLFQFGIRSGTKDEFDIIRKHNLLDRDFDEVKAIIGNKPVYVSIDMDILDPSIFPGTGTPEPGGWTYKEMERFIAKFSGMNVVSADIVELSPHYDTSGVSTLVAAKMIRELLLAF